MPTKPSSSRVRARAARADRPRWRISGSSICRPIVIIGFSDVIGSWNTIDRREPRRSAISRSGNCSKSRPSKMTEPAGISAGGDSSRRSRASDVMVLPLPLSPTRPRVSPWRRLNETPSTARSAPPGTRKRTCRFSTRSTVAAVFSCICRAIVPALVSVTRHSDFARLPSIYPSRRLSLPLSPSSNPPALLVLESIHERHAERSASWRLGATHERRRPRHRHHRWQRHHVVRTRCRGSGSEPTAGGVAEGSGHKRASTPLAEDRYIVGSRRVDGSNVDVTHGDALADCVAIAAGGHEAHAPIAYPDGLEAGSVGVLGIDLKRHEALGRAAAIAFAERRVPPDEGRFVEGDEAVEAAHTRRIGPGELARPDAETLFEPQGIHDIKADLPQPQIGAGLEKPPIERPLFGGR